MGIQDGTVDTIWYSESTCPVPSSVDKNLYLFLKSINTKCSTGIFLDVLCTGRVASRTEDETRIIIQYYILLG